GVARDASTGRAIVLVDDRAENSIVVVGGANAALTPDHLEPAADALTRAAVVVAQLEVPVETVTAAARRAAGTFVLNPAPARELPRERLERVDRRGVTATVAGVVRGPPGPAARAEIPALVAGKGLARTVVQPLGARGALPSTGVEVEGVPASTVP